MRIFTMVALSAATLSLAACMGSSSGGEDTPFNTDIEDSIEDTSGGEGTSGGDEGTSGGDEGTSGGDEGTSDEGFPAYVSDALDILEKLEGDELDLASAEMMSGDVSMTGAVGIDNVGESDDETLELVGELSVTAKFDDEDLSISGTAENFVLIVSDSGFTVESELDGDFIINGTITGTEIDANFGGTLTEDEANGSEVHNVQVEMDGDFYDYDGTLTAGGDVTAIIDNEDFGGVFALTEEQE